MSARTVRTCGHSVCSQSYVDTGDLRCVVCEWCERGDTAFVALNHRPAHRPPGGGFFWCVGRSFRLDSAIVGTAHAIRAALPWVTLSEALTYADASTVQGRAFRGAGTGTFFGLGYSRTDLAFGLAWYFTLWASEKRNHVRGVHLGVCARLETETDEVRRCYGAIVRKRHALLTGYERYARRAKRAGRTCPEWPGTRNMPPHGSEHATIRAWLLSHGILAVCLALAPRGRGPAYSHMRAMLDAPEVHS